MPTRPPGPDGPQAVFHVQEANLLRLEHISGAGFFRRHETEAREGLRALFHDAGPERRVAQGDVILAFTVERLEQSIACLDFRVAAIAVQQHVEERKMHGQRCHVVTAEEFRDIGLVALPGNLLGADQEIRGPAGRIDNELVAARIDDLDNEPDHFAGA